MTPTEPAPTPGLANAYPTSFDTAWYASRSPAEQALYYGRPGVTIPAGSAILTVAQYQALYEHLVANPPVTPSGQVRPLVHQIANWGWGPYEANYDAVNQGVAWWPADQGNVEGTEVVTPGEYAGTPPAGTPYTPVTLNVADLLAGGSIGPWPETAPAPVVISDVVGVQENGNEYGTVNGVAVGPGTSYPVGTKETDVRGTFILTVLYNMFGATYVWVLQPVAATGSAATGSAATAPS